MRDERTLEQRLTGLRQPISSARQSADLTAMASVRPSGGRLASKARVAAAFAAGLLLGSTGLAAANALPDPAQHVAHQALDQVGIEVPDPERYHGPGCGEQVQRNHGGYVKVDKGLAKSDCGKPVGPGGDDAADDDGEGGKGAGPAAKGPCQGKPPWAGNKAMTPEEKAAAQAERVAQCGTDDDEADEAEAGATEAPAVEESTTTTAVDATTTTEATTTTVEDTTTTTTAG